MTKRTPAQHLGDRPASALTVREWFAGQVASGLAAASPSLSPDGIAAEAIRTADAILEQLAQEQKRTPPCPLVRQQRSPEPPGYLDLDALEAGVNPEE